MLTEITYRCGHTATVQIYGSAKERDSKAAWYSRSVDCAECKARAQAEINAKAAGQAKADGLPELTGSDKQIAWAVTIRGKAIEMLNEMAKTDNDRKAITALVNTATAAKDWIDNREHPTQLMRIYGAQIREALGK